VTPGSLGDVEVDQSCMTLDPTRNSGWVGSGWVRKCTGKGESGWVQFARYYNLTLKCFDNLYFIVHFSLL